MSTKSEVGRLGEDIACRYLEKEGYTVRHRNFRAGHLETDIICENAEHLLFVEVKTRRSTGAHARYGSARDAVSAKKLARIKECAEEYLRANKTEKRPRIDLVEVYLTRQEAPSVNWIKNILA